MAHFSQASLPALPELSLSGMSSRNLIDLFGYLCRGKSMQFTRQEPSLLLPVERLVQLPPRGHRPTSESYFMPALRSCIPFYSLRPMSVFYLISACFSAITHAI